LLITLSSLAAVLVVAAHITEVAAVLAGLELHQVSPFCKALRIPLL
jgi:hypothetical protein